MEMRLEHLNRRECYERGRRKGFGECLARVIAYFRISYKEPAIHVSHIDLERLEQELKTFVLERRPESAKSKENKPTIYNVPGMWI